MLKLHFQVTCMDKKDYILEYKDFSWEEIDAMLSYISFNGTKVECQTIKITRWNEKGEKA